MHVPAWNSSQDPVATSERVGLQYKDSSDPKVAKAGIEVRRKAMYDVLPSPSNLHVWGKVETPACPLCSKHGTLEHILSSCVKALGEGRYRWWHEQVLKSLAELITARAERARHLKTSQKSINFVKAGEQPKISSARTSAGILALARDWQLQVDLE